MQQINDPLLKWRPPTAQEKERIEQIWGENEKTYCSPVIRNIFKYFGIFLIVISVATVLKGDTAGAVVTLIVAVTFILFASALNSARKLHKLRISAFEEGNYLVAEAYSTAVYRGKGNDYRSGRTDVSLPSGGCVKYLKMPTCCTDPLIRQNIQKVPLLLIQVQGDETTLTIPVNQ